MTETRSRLVAATNELFRRHGYHGTSLSMITESARAPTGSLYHFFPEGKAQLAEAVLRETGAAYRELFEVIADGAPDAASAIETFFDGAADTLESTDFVDVCPIGTVAREVASTHDRLRAAAHDVFESWIATLTGRLVASGCDAREAPSLAATVVATLEGAFVLARASRDTTVLRAAGRHLSPVVAAACVAVDAPTSGRRRHR